MRCKVNLLAVNAAGGVFGNPGMERILAFQKLLRDAGYTVFIRQSRGADTGG